MSDWPDAATKRFVQATVLKEMGLPPSDIVDFLNSDDSYTSAFEQQRAVNATLHGIAKQLTEYADALSAIVKAHCGDETPSTYPMHALNSVAEHFKRKGKDLNHAAERLFLIPVDSSEGAKTFANHLEYDVKSLLVSKDNLDACVKNNDVDWYTQGTALTVEELTAVTEIRNRTYGHPRIAEDKSSLTAVIQQCAATVRGGPERL